MLKTHFNTYKESREQELLEDLVIEYIQQFGQEIMYLPRRRGNFNELYYDDDQSYFDTFYPIEMYIKNINGFGGDRTFMSKFDIEIRDQMVFSIARRRFGLEITAAEGFDAPREGDLIYFPMNGKLFQIMFTENKPFFYQLGTMQMFDITCEVFEFSSEKFMTGIPEIDVNQSEHTQDVLEYAVKDASGSPIISGEFWYVTDEKLATSVAEDGSDDTDLLGERVMDEEIINWNESNPYSLTNPY